jgi:uncharacterized protein (TIGR03086 family)
MNKNALLRRAGVEFEHRLAAVSPDQMCLPTPCQEWTVRDLINHVVTESIMSVQLLHGATADQVAGKLAEDFLGNDAIDAFVKATSDERAAFTEPDAMERVVHHPAMDMLGIQLLGFRIGGITLHMWDLARAIDGDETLDSDLVEAVWTQLSPMAPFIAQTGVFGAGPSGKIGRDAPLRHRLLDLTGRRP